jgi:transposase
MAYSLDLRKRIVRAVKAGYKHEEIAEQFGVGVATVRRYVQRDKQGRLAPDSPPGRPADIPSEQYSVLTRQVRKYPDATLKKQCELWLETQATKVSVTAMCRALQRAKLTRKKRPAVPVNAMKKPASRI